MLTSATEELKALLKTGSPIMVSQLAQTAMGFVDAAMAGQYSTTSLAAIAIGSGLWLPLFLALSGVLIAITPLTAQAYGAKDFAAVKRHLQQGIYLALLLGLVLITLIYPFSQLVYLLKADADVSLQAERYLLAVGCGLPAVIFYQALRCFNDGMHNTRIQMYISLLALAANIMLNYTLIYGHFGLPELGSLGCGIATAIVMWLEAICMLLYFYFQADYRALKLWQTISRIDWHEQKALIALGLPIGLSIFTEVSMFSIVSLLLAPLGETVIAAHQIAVSFSGMVFMLPLSISMAITLRAGFYLGAGQQKQARLSSLSGGLICLFIACFSYLFMSYFPYLITAYSTQDPAVHKLASSLLMLAAIYQFSDAIQITAAGTLRAYKDTRIPFYIILFASWCIGLPLGYQLAFAPLESLNPPLGARGFWCAFIAALSFAAICLSSRCYYVQKHYRTA